MTEPEIMAWLGIPPGSGLRLREGLRTRVLEALDGMPVPGDENAELTAFTRFLRACGPYRLDTPMYVTECAHCGQETQGYAIVQDAAGTDVRVCHPDDPARPDCYRRVTVYAEPLGALRGPFALPRGTDRIRRTEPLPGE